MAEIVSHGQALQAPAVGKSVADEIHAPHLVDFGGDVQWRAIGRWSAHLLALAHRQVRIAVQPVHALVVDGGEVCAQQVVHTSMAEAPARELVIGQWGLIP